LRCAACDDRSFIGSNAASAVPKSLMSAFDPLRSFKQLVAYWRRGRFMHIDLPKAFKGWRKVAGEIAIIVVGVLIALGLDQYVQARQWRQQVAQAEEGFQWELALGAQDAYERLAIQPCLQGRIRELAERLNREDPRWSALPLELNAKYYRNALPVVYRAPYRTVFMDAWRNALADQTLNHLSSQRSSQLSGLYKAREEFGRLQEQELQAAGRLTPLAYDRPLDADGRREMLQVLAEIDRTNTLLIRNSEELLAALKKFEVKFGKAEVAAMRKEVLDVQRDYRGSCVQELPLDLD
jgi:hypothetical protein